MLGAAQTVVTRDDGIFGTTSIVIAGTRAVGELEAYICRKCGYLEWYCVAPETIPIGEAHNTELLDVSSGGPYR